MIIRRIPRSCDLKTSNNLFRTFKYTWPYNFKPSSGTQNER